MNTELFKELLEVDTTSLNMKLPIALGKSEDGTICFRDLISLHHIFIAGVSGQGKTSCLNGIIASLSNNCYHPELVLISAKGAYELYHTATIPLAKTEFSDIMCTLEKLYEEMEFRFKLFKRKGVRSLEEYDNKHPDCTPLRYIVVLIDDFDHLFISPDCKHKISSLISIMAQKGDQVGIHLIITTQRLTYNIILGCLKANFYTSIAFKVAAEHESRMILYKAGAEK